jgi:hypothetical protein
MIKYYFFTTMNITNMLHEDRIEARLVSSRLILELMVGDGGLTASETAEQ